MALTARSQSGSRSTIVLALVIALHVAVFYGIQSGLARKMVQLLPPDIQTKIIKEDKPDEPPPPPPPPPPEIQTPPPFVPPPEVTVQMPVAATSAIQAVTNERPVVAPPPAPAPAKDVVVAPKVTRTSGSLEEYYPSSAKRDGQEGSVIVAVYVAANGKVGDVKVEESSGYPALDDGALKFARTWKFTPGTRNGAAEAAWFRTKVTFKLTK